MRARKTEMVGNHEDSGGGPGEAGRTDYMLGVWSGKKISTGGGHLS